MSVIVNDKSYTVISGSFRADTIENYGDAVTIKAGKGNDEIDNEAANVSINAGAGNDEIDNEGDNVNIDGSSGDDEIESEGNNVSIVGGLGNDSIESEGYYVTITGGKGNDLIELEKDKHGGNLIRYAYGDGNDTIYNFAATDTLAITGNPYTRATVGNDIVLTVKKSTITLKDAKGKPLNIDGKRNGGSAEDDYEPTEGRLINNTKNNKNLNGTNFNDTITNSARNVTINAGAGNDEIDNRGSRVTILGGAGNDDIENKGSYVTIDAGDGNDEIDNESSYVSISGGKGNDDIENEGSNVTITGGDGADTIENEGSKVSISGDAGNDEIDSEGFNVTISGGKGDDVIIFEKNSRNNVIEYAKGDGNDVIYNFDASNRLNITGGTYTRATVGNDVILSIGKNSITLKNVKGKTININGTLDGGNSSTGGGSSIEGKYINNTKNRKTVDGTAYDDTIKNSGGEVTINAGAGDDEINNKSSNVVINGGAGDDEIDNKNSNVTITGGSGNDELDNAGANVYIDGGKGDDEIDNKGSRVTISGGKGDDVITLKKNKLRNVIDYAAGDGNDTIFNFGTTDTLNITGAKYTRSTVGNDVVLKVDSGKILLRNARNTAININGTIAGGVSTVKTVTNSTSSPVTVGSAVKIINASSRTKAVKITGNALDNSIVGGTKNDTIYGGKGNDTLTGGKGNDKLAGQSGNDTLWGGAGNDSLWGGKGNDTFIYQAGDGKDKIFDYSSGDILKILKADGAAGGKYKKSKFSDGTLALTISGGGSLLFKNVTTSTNFNINDKSYKISGSKLVKK